MSSEGTEGIKSGDPNSWVDFHIQYHDDGTIEAWLGILGQYPKQE